ncbi:MAG: UMP kinase [Bacteroidales bacterium]|jgi:uridylate kinase|nr:UMP kinase [Bacteroidales bacterium]MDD3701301.1 UMP kinase [Bacteroidales bacterium]MDY0368430.1 UMP kinase [Bacteroidales bacterium]
MKYQRIVLKLSGEALMGSQHYGIDPQRLQQYADEVIEAFYAGAQVAIVIGGGNIFRGLQGLRQGMDRVQGDYMGMLATTINSLALQSTLQKTGMKVSLLSGLYIDRIAESMSGSKAVELLEQRHIVIISGGTGNPFFTTDSAAALRAVEIQADAILKGTRVDGIYSADPEKDPQAVKYTHLSFEQAYNEKLKVMDLTAFTLCSENNMPIIVFDMNKKGNLLKVIQGEAIGTTVSH